MLKNNWDETKNRFDRWWARENGAVLVIADVKRAAPSYKNLEDFTNLDISYNKFLEYLQNGSFYGDVVPDLSTYLGPGSLATFIGAEPIFSDETIWYKEAGVSLDIVQENSLYFLEAATSGNIEDIPWFNWSLKGLAFYADNTGGAFYPSMPDLGQNLDILSAVMGPQRLLIELIDNRDRVKEILDTLYEVWKIAFNMHWELICDSQGYTAYTHYNLLGKGKTSVLQSDISCMLSEDMFNELEMPNLRKQCMEIDNAIYHLDGPGSTRHLDSILGIENINAVQWVPGAGQPGNADECWHELYDKITKSGKGLYVSLKPNEIDAFLEKYGSGHILIRTQAESCEEQQKLAEKYMWA